MTYANVVSSLALFLVVAGGSAFAAATITGADIVDESVTGADIKTSSLTGGDVLDGTVASIDVFNQSLTGVDVADDSLSGVDVLESSFGKVPSASVADQAPVAGWEIVYAQAHQTGSFNEARAQCPEGKVALGGGGGATPTSYARLTGSQPLGQTAWRVTGVNSQPGSEVTITARVICGRK